MADIIKATRGLKIDFEEVPLLLGEPGLATDEERLYIGGNNGNIPLPNAADLSEIANDITPLIPITATTTIYVSVSTGSDTTGDGTQINPYKTISYALSKINKILYSSAKIRVLAGDYTSEGVLSVLNFSKSFLTITAFDGTNDIIIPNDDYKILRIEFFQCNQIAITGFRIMYSSTGNYGIFLSNVVNAHVTGVKNIEGSQVNNGFGVTEGTDLVIENCLIANKDTIVSCNNRSKVLAKDFATGSINNKVGLWAHGGAIITKSGTQATTTQYPIFQDTGGVIIGETGMIETQANKKYQVQFNITDSSNTITIPISLLDTPKEIKIVAIVDGAKSYSEGSWINGSSICTRRSQADVLSITTGNIIEVDGGDATYNFYSISSVSKSSIVLGRITAYTGMTGKTIKLNVYSEC